MKINKIILILLIAFSNSYAWKLDQRVKKDESKFWKAHYDVPKYSAVVILSTFLYEGTDSRIGKTSLQSMDAGLLSQVITEGVKKTMGRVRPRYTDSSNEWFEEDGQSFPSGHVSGMTALVTPYILEYQHDQPLVHLLWTLPAYQMVGRVKAQAHWQSDVIAAALVGFASGYIVHTYDIPITLYFTEENAMIGLKHRF